MARKLVGSRSKTGVQIGGVDDVLVRFGRCCNPVPGDPIVGFITRGRGVTVHTVGCEQRARHRPRAPGGRGLGRPRRLQATGDAAGAHRGPPGLAGRHVHHLQQEGRQHHQANCRATGDDRAVNTFEVTISDLKQLTDVMRTIERLNGVYSVERV